MLRVTLAASGASLALVVVVVVLCKRRRPVQRVVQFGRHVRCAFGSSSDCFLQPLKESSAAWEAQDWEQLRCALDEDGYLLIRSVLPKRAVDAARDTTLTKLDSVGSLDVRHPRREGILRERCGLGCVPFLEGQNEVTHSASVLAVLEHDWLRQLFQALFEVDDVTSFQFKWLRAMPNDSFTGAHMDWVYMGRGSPRLLTCWIPMGDNPIEMGTLAVCEASHRLPALAKLRATYGEMDHERDGLDGTGWFTEDPMEVTRLFGRKAARWRTADFYAGDVLVFGMKTLHMSTTNVTQRARISADTRWLPSSEAADPRYSGNVQRYVAEEMAVAGAWTTSPAAESPTSDARATEDADKDNPPPKSPTTPRTRPSASGQGCHRTQVTMDELRQRWGFPSFQAP